MSADDLESDAGKVLSRYRLGSFTKSFLGNAGGFSGARLWRVDSEIGSFCLKAWPPEKSAPNLRHVHQWMEIARSAGRRFVPALMRTIDDAAWQLHGGRFWDLSEWMPGTADFWANPSTDRIRAACIALASLHDVWSRRESQTGVCPAVQRRLNAWNEWKTLLDAGWRPNFAANHLDPLASLANRAWDVLSAHISNLPDLLEQFRDRRLRLHPCLCDIWHDHVLFEGNRVSGMIDFGSMRVDSPATDLARMLGSLAGDNEQLFGAGLEAYRSIRGDSTPDAEFIRVLDRTGTIIALTQWLRWLYHDFRRFDDQQAVERRLGQLVNRLAPSPLSDADL
jgi:homoserine kinase type II